MEETQKAWGLDMNASGQQDHLCRKSEKKKKKLTKKVPGPNKQLQGDLGRQSQGASISHTPKCQQGAWATEGETQFH